MKNVFLMCFVVVLVAHAELAVAREPGCEETNKEAPSQFDFQVYDAKTIRDNPTTQIAITKKDWPHDVFLLWLPEDVRPVWNQWTPAVAHQDFRDNGNGGLLWSYTKKDVARITAELQPKKHSIVCTVRVTNLSKKDFNHVCAQNCLHFSQAPHFACDDFSRIFIRVDGKWQSLKDLHPTSGLPMYYAPGFLESGKIDMWQGAASENNQPARADHPLIICLDKQKKRAVATASQDFQCLFHNRDSKYLRCIHSQQSPVPALSPGETATFRQWIFFANGGVSEALLLFNQSEAASHCKIVEDANNAIEGDMK